MTKITTALDLSSDQWDCYSQTTNSPPLTDLARWQRGWHLAGDLANLLRERFGATQVAVFGSINSPDWFDADSDLDLVVWGIAPAQFYQAVAAVTAISSEFEVDLIDGNAPPAHLIKTLEDEAISI